MVCWALVVAVLLASSLVNEVHVRRGLSYPGAIGVGMAAGVASFIVLSALLSWAVSPAFQ